MLRVERGLSIIEVIVALLIVAISLGGAIYTVGVAARNEATISNKTFARWVAMNHIAEEKIKHAFPKVGTSKGEEDMAGAKWKWSQKVLSTADKNVRRIEVSVWMAGHESDGVDAMVVGFLVKP